jgi:hypothetical protein
MGLNYKDPELIYTVALLLTKHSINSKAYMILNRLGFEKLTYLENSGIIRSLTQLNRQYKPSVSEITLF